MNIKLDLVSGKSLGIKFFSCFCPFFNVVASMPSIELLYILFIWGYKDGRAQESLNIVIVEGIV